MIPIIITSMAVHHCNTCLVVTHRVLLWVNRQCITIGWDWHRQRLIPVQHQPNQPMIMILRIDGDLKGLLEMIWYVYQVKFVNKQPFHRVCLTMFIKWKDYTYGDWHTPYIYIHTYKTSNDTKTRRVPRSSSNTFWIKLSIGRSATLVNYYPNTPTINQSTN